jgi:hypothetical protein
MEPSLSSSPALASVSARTPLLRAALEVLVDELSLSSPSIRLVETEALDLAPLRSLMLALEARSRQEIEHHVDRLGTQLLALQAELQFWRECQNVSFGKFCEPIP